MNNRDRGRAPAHAQTQTPRLKIALLVDRFGTHFGGAESYAVELARELAEQHDVTIIARDYASEVLLPFIKIPINARLPAWVRVLYFCWRAERIVKRHRFDIVHSHASGWVGDIQVVHVTPVHAKKIFNKSPFRKLKAWTSPRIAAYLMLEKSRMRYSPGRRVVAVSRRIDDDLHRSYQNLATTIIFPGVRNTDYARDPERRAKTRHQLGCHTTDIVCLLVARNPLRKGLPTLLRAIGTLPPHYRLVVVGADQAARRKMRHHPTIADRVQLIDPSREVDRFYEAADVYVHPTLDDAFGMAPLEAMAFGLPVVVSSRTYCGLSECLTDRQNALILNNPEDDQEIAQHILRLTQDRTLRDHLHPESRKIVAAHAWHTIASRYVALYQESLAEKRA